MVGGPFAAVFAVVLGIVFVVVGFLNLPVCGGGPAYFWFGLAVMAFGGAAATVGSIPALFAGLAIGFLLVGIGVGVSYHACGAITF